MQLFEVRIEHLCGIDRDFWGASAESSRSRFQRYTRSGVAMRKYLDQGSSPCESMFLLSRTAQSSEVPCLLLASANKTICPSRSYATKSIFLSCEGMTLCLSLESL